MHGKGIAEIVMMRDTVGRNLQKREKEKKASCKKEGKGDRACHGKSYSIACMDKLRSAASGGFGLRYATWATIAWIA